MHETLGKVLFMAQMPHAEAARALCVQLKAAWMHTQPGAARPRASPGSCMKSAPKKLTAGGCGELADGCRARIGCSALLVCNRPLCRSQQGVSVDRIGPAQRRDRRRLKGWDTAG